MQAGLTSILLWVWQFYIFNDIYKAFQSQLILVFFIATFGMGFGILFHSLSTALRVFATSVATAIMVTLVLVVYPQFGFVVEWYILFGILTLSGVLAHALLYGSGARYGGNEYD